MIQFVSWLENVVYLQEKSFNLFEDHKNGSCPIYDTFTPKREKERLTQGSQTLVLHTDCGPPNVILQNSFSSFF